MFPFYTERAPEQGDVFVPLRKGTRSRLSICSNILYEWKGDKQEAHSVWPHKYTLSLIDPERDPTGSFLSRWQHDSWAMLVWRGRYDNEPYLKRTTLGIKVNGFTVGSLPVEPKAEFVALSWRKGVFYTFSANKTPTLGWDTYRYIPQEWVEALI